MSSLFVLLIVLETQLNFPRAISKLDLKIVVMAGEDLIIAVWRYCNLTRFVFQGNIYRKVKTEIWTADAGKD